MPSLKDPNIIVQPGPGLIPPGVVTASSLLFIPGAGGVLPTVWTDDLLGSTNVAQFINSISGHAGAGGLVALNIMTLSYGSTQVTPLITQALLASGTGQPLSIQAQSVTTGTGGNLVLGSGAGSAAAGFVDIQSGGTTVWQLGASFGLPVVDYSAIYGSATPSATNYVLRTEAFLLGGNTWLNATGPGYIYFNQANAAMFAMTLSGGVSSFYGNSSPSATTYIASTDGSNLSLNAPINSLSNFVEIQQGGLVRFQFGTIGSGTSTLWANPGGTLDSSNFVLAQSTAGNVFLNAQTSGYVFVFNAGVSQWSMGPLVGTPSSSAFYGPAGPTAINYVLATDGTNLLINAPGFSGPGLVTLQGQVSGTPASLLAVGGGGLHLYPFSFAITDGANNVLTTADALFPKIVLTGEMSLGTTITFPSVEGVWVIDLSGLTIDSGYFIFATAVPASVVYLNPLQDDLIIVSVGAAGATVTVSPNQVVPSAAASVAAGNWHSSQALSTIGTVSTPITWPGGTSPATWAGFGYDTGTYGAWFAVVFSAGLNDYINLLGTYDGGVNWTLLQSFTSGSPGAASPLAFTTSGPFESGRFWITSGEPSQPAFIYYASPSFISDTGYAGSTCSLATMFVIGNFATGGFIYSYYVSTTVGAWTGTIAQSTDENGTAFNNATGLPSQFASGTGNIAAIFSAVGFLGAAPSSRGGAALVAISGTIAGTDPSFLMSVENSGPGSISGTNIVPSPNFLAGNAQVTGVAYDSVNGLWGVAVNSGGFPYVYSSPDLVNFTVVYGNTQTIPIPNPGVDSAALVGLACANGVWVISNTASFLTQNVIYSGDVASQGANATWHIATTSFLATNTGGVGAGIYSGGAQFLAANTTSVQISFQAGYP